MNEHDVKRHAFSKEIYCEELYREDPTRPGQLLDYSWRNARVAIVHGRQDVAGVCFDLRHIHRVTASIRRWFILATVILGAIASILVWIALRLPT